MDINCHQSLTAHEGAGLKNVFNAIHFPIANTLASFLETTDLINLSRTSISCYYAFKAVKSSQWNINNFLSPFLRDPRSFRSVMAECDAVISGSTALQFFDRVRWSESDLDIYIHIGESVHHKSQPIVLKTLGYHLMEKEGYQYTPDRRQHPDFNLAGTIREKLDNPEDEDGGEIYQLNDKIAGVYTFSRTPRDGPGPPKEIQIITTTSLPLQCILLFHSTAVQNLITWNKAYSLFPKATFIDRTTLVINLQWNNPREAKYLEKYRDRGWNVIRQIPDSPHTPFQQERFVRDSYSWVMPLDISGVTKPEKPDYVLELSGFTLDPDGLRQRPGQPRAPMYSYISSTMGSLILRYKYQLGFTDFYPYLHHKIHKLVKIESMRLRPDDPPLEFKDQYIDWELLESRAKMGLGVYYDSCIPGYFYKYMVKQKKPGFYRSAGTYKKDARIL